MPGEMLLGSTHALNTTQFKGVCALIVEHRSDQASLFGIILY